MPRLSLDRRALLATGIGLAASGPARAQPVSADVVLGGKIRLADLRAVESSRVTIAAERDGVTIVGVASDAVALSADGEIALVAGALPGFETGIQLWRYAPWKAWTRPSIVMQLADLAADDIQLLFWRETDGSVVVLVPLSGAGFRTTIGRIGDRFAVRAAAGAPASVPATLPLLAIGHGRDPHAVIAATYRAALDAMGRQATQAVNKQLPEPLRYLGWNSWNASDLGKKLDEKLLIDAATTLSGAGVPVGWMLVDDGYFDQREQRLRSFAPDRTKFPNGFAALIERLKRDHGIRHVGAWLALDGYWHGIDPASPLGEAYRADLFTWSEPRDPADPASPLRTNSFVRPDRPAMARFYDEHLRALRAAGFEFIKVDNQLVVERMAKRNFPIWDLATAMHDGMNTAARRHFDDAMINCMDLTADAYFNFGSTPVARAVEDYFPFKTDETYDLEKGNAAAHVLQAIYNALYVGEVAIPDFDMFETTNPNARLHAVARAANNGPIYVTDVPGRHDIKLLRSLTLADGTTLRADRPLLPCQDCLFQLQAAKPFKAFSGVGDVGLLMIANLADAEHVEGNFAARDVPGFGRRPAVAYEHLTGRLERLGAVPVAVALPRFGVELWSFHHLANGVAVFGRSDKINGAATVAGRHLQGGAVLADLHEMGPTAAFTAIRPRSVTIEGAAARWTWRSGLLLIEAPATGRPGTIRIDLGRSGGSSGKTERADS